MSVENNECSYIGEIPGGWKEILVLLLKDLYERCGEGAAESFSKNLETLSIDAQSQLLIIYRMAGGADLLITLLNTMDNPPYLVVEQLANFLPDDRVEDRLIQAAMEQRGELRASAIRALGKGRTELSIGLAREGLSDEYPKVQSDALVCLIHRSDFRYLEDAKQFLRSDSLGKQLAGIYYLGFHSDEEAIGMLKHFRNGDFDREVKSGADAALRMIFGPEEYPFGAIH